MNKINFYDTNMLLHTDIYNTENKIYLSSITLQELENIKVSRNKDEEVKFNARNVTRWLRENENKYECIVANKNIYEILNSFDLEVDNDNLICACAYSLQLQDECNEVTFYTDDLCCYNLAKNIFKLKCDGNYLKKKITNKGYKEIIMTDEQLADFYSQEEKLNKYDLKTNEYLIIKDTLNQPIDAWRFDGDKLIELEVKPIKSNILGKLKAKDFYQQCALDSFYNNKLTVIKGKAGSGKSYLAMNYMLSQLEKGKIDKIVIFTNPVSTRGSQEIGFLPGTRDEKLLESNIGNFLLGKFGDRNIATSMINLGTLVLLPISDIRGFDTTGQNCIVYITESQNMSIDMMKLALQRIGDDCTCIIDGDCDTQVDNKLFEGNNNGMNRLSEVFSGKSIYGEIELKNIYRSELAKIADEM